MGKTNVYILLFCGLMFFSACKKETAPKKSHKPIGVQVSKVTQEDFKTYQIFNGVTRYQKQENIKSKVTGYVSYLPYEKGDRLKKGQVFATVRTKEQDALREASKIDSTLAKFSKPLVIHANANGILTAVNVNPNDYVSEGEVMATLAQTSTLIVQVNIPFEFSQKIHVGTVCQLLLPNRPILEAKITSTLPQIDPSTQTQGFLIALPQTELPTNLNLRVKILSKETKNALVIPAKALQTNALLTKYWVMRIKEDTLALKTPLKLIKQNDSLVQIDSTQLKIGDRIITEGAYQMPDSTAVKIQ